VAVADGGAVAVAVGEALPVGEAVAVGVACALPGVTRTAGRDSAGAASPPPWLAIMPAVKVATPMAPDTTHVIVARDPVIPPPGFRSG
jgi:hypothetical protein